MDKYSYLSSMHAAYIEDLFDLYLEDPEKIDTSWRYFFEGLELGETFKKAPAFQIPSESPQELQKTQSHQITLEAKVAELIHAYRNSGRLIAAIDPLEAPPQSHPLLELSQFGMTSSQLSQTFAAGRLIGLGTASLKDIIERLQAIYCRSVGVEMMHLQNLEERKWLQEALEIHRFGRKMDPETRKWILNRLIQSESFEKFLHTRYVAQKRFSIEGAESLIPALDCFIEKGAELGAEEFVFGMAHRGRLNVLANIFKKNLEYIFTEFENAYAWDQSLGEGDVKYHMGFSSDYQTRLGRKVHLSLASNPSHLEFVNPVIQGMTRAKQSLRKDTSRSRVIAMTIHGDAAFSGQGVCYETLNLSQLEGYSTGGTIHIVINNQVGFTTDPKDGRSTTYCTDLAKMLEVPIFHVNGDDPESLWSVAELCIEYRQRFKKDAVIDLICYRRYGHNEGDEPAFTQPRLYKKIRSFPSVVHRYTEKLLQEAVVSQDEVDSWHKKYQEELGNAQLLTKKEAPQPFISVFQGRWDQFRRPLEEELFESVSTLVDEKELKKLGQSLNEFPKGFQVNSKLLRLFEARRKAIEEGKGLDWGNAETLAYASLLTEGHSVRISGQDVQRGTFSHRHAVLHDSETGEYYRPLSHLSPTQGSFQIHNSLLSETAVLGFEYGYSSSEPNDLVIWEAQFGDFVNSAQVIIDQFISSSESKWQRMSGIVLFLPHGFEGQGPEHSSARLERFLQLCGRNNMVVCNLTRPSQLFHALRRQVLWSFRKPLVIMTPKSLLRHPRAISNLSELSNENFSEVLLDPVKKPSSISRVLLCSGKIYYDLLQAQQDRGDEKTALIRLEQFYPWPEKKLSETLNRFPKAEICWVQEEPRNMGAWGFVFQQWMGGLGELTHQVKNRAIRYIGRAIGAAPAVGSPKVHAMEQKEIIEKAFS